MALVWGLLRRRRGWSRASGPSFSARPGTKMDDRSGACWHAYVRRPSFGVHLLRLHRIATTSSSAWPTARGRHHLCVTTTTMTVPLCAAGRGVNGGGGPTRSSQPGVWVHVPCTSVIVAIRGGVLVIDTSSAETGPHTVPTDFRGSSGNNLDSYKEEQQQEGSGVSRPASTLDEQVCDCQL